MDFISIDDENQTVPKQLSQKKKGNKNLQKVELSYPSKSKHGAKKRFRQRAGGIIYVGHIPHGFYEDEMKAYFNQFGKVLATAVSRSKKTGKSRGYGFVQFQDEDVAKIAAETMNNYLMFNKILKCRYIPPEERNSDVCEGTISVSNFPRQENRKMELKRKMESLSRMSQTAYLERVQKKVNEFKKFFEKNGINFNLKINGEIKQDNESTVSDTKSFSNPDEDFGNESDNINGVLEIDESENEISFKTPPQVKKVFKKSLNSSTVCQDIPSNKSLVKKVKKSNLRSKRIKGQEKSKEKLKVALLKQSQKIKEARENFEKSMKRRESLRSNVKNRRMEKSTSNSNTDSALRMKKQRNSSGNLKLKKDKNKGIM